MKKSISIIAFVCMAFFINAQSQIKNSKNVEDEKEMPELFKKYDWLKEHADYKYCKNIIIQQYQSDKNPTIFVGITKQNKFKMYATDGSLYCSNSNILDCKEFYKLKEVGELWKCP